MGHGLYVVSVTLHILAAAVWIGGLVFIAAVFVPLLRRRDLGGAARSRLYDALDRFRTIAWVALATLVATGIANLAYRGWTWARAFDPATWSGPFGKALAVKLMLVAAIFTLAAAHDFVVGPRVRALEAQGAAPERVRGLRKLAGWIGRLNLLLTLGVAAAAVLMLRGLAG